MHLYSGVQCTLPGMLVLSMLFFVCQALGHSNLSLERCSLPILTPNIGPAGTKSRVETQVRIALDLAMPGAMPGIQNNYDLVGSWKWLRLPKGTATRKRSRKEGRIGELSHAHALWFILNPDLDPSPSDTLFLETDVTCASNPSKQVTSCNTCQGREV